MTSCVLNFALNPVILHWQVSHCINLEIETLLDPGERGILLRPRTDLQIQCLIPKLKNIQAWIVEPWSSLLKDTVLIHSVLEGFNPIISSRGRRCGRSWKRPLVHGKSWPLYETMDIRAQSAMRIHNVTNIIVSPNLGKSAQSPSTILPR